MRALEAVAYLRGLLTALETKSMTIHEKGDDVTQRETKRLRSNVEHLESTFPPPAVFPDEVGDWDPTKWAEHTTARHEPGIGPHPKSQDA